MALTLKRYGKKTVSVGEDLFRKKIGADKLAKLKSEVSASRGRGGGGRGYSSGGSELNKNYKRRTMEWAGMDREFSSMESDITKKFQTGVMDYTSYAYETYKLQEAKIADYRARLDDPIFKAKYEQAEEKVTVSLFNKKRIYEQNIKSFTTLQQRMIPYLKDIEGVRITKDFKANFDMVAQDENGEPLITPAPLKNDEGELIKDEGDNIKYGNYVIVYNPGGETLNKETQQRTKTPGEMEIIDRREFEEEVIKEDLDFRPIGSPVVGPDGFKIFFPMTKGKEIQQDGRVVDVYGLTTINKNGAEIFIPVQKTDDVPEGAYPETDMEQIWGVINSMENLQSAKVFDETEIEEGKILQDAVTGQSFELKDNLLYPVDDYETFTKDGYTEEDFTQVAPEFLDRYDIAQEETEPTPMFEQSMQPQEYLPSQQEMGPDFGGYTGLAPEAPQMQPQMQQGDILDDLMRRYNIFGLRNFQPRQPQYGRSKGFNLGF